MLKWRSRPTKLRETASGMRRIYQHVSPYMAQHRGLAIGSALALIGATLMRLLEPLPVKLVIDRVVVVGAQQASSGIAWIDSLPPMQLLVFCSAMVVTAIGLRALFGYVSTVGFALAGSRIMGQLRHDLYCHLQSLSLSFHDRARTGDLTMRMVGDVGMMREAAVTALLPLATNVLIVTGMAGVMLWLNWQLALIALAPVPLLALATVKLGKRIQTVSREQRKREGGIAAATSESMAGMRVVQALSLEGRMTRTFASHNAGSLTDGVRAKRLSASLERATDIIAGVSTAMVLGFGALLVIRRTITPGDLIVFLTYLKSTFRPIRDFAKNTSRIAKATAAGERVVDLLEEEPDICDAPDAVTAPPFRGRICFDAVGFAYPGGGEVMNGFNLSIAPGELVALVGHSGAGKSTAASLLMRLYDPLWGRILIDGRDIRSFTLPSLRGQISTILQEPLLFSETIRENIALSCPEASDAEIEAAARLANAHEFIMRLPDGYDTVLSERGASLSMGQRQRIAIARAALRQSPILVLDEPTASLDRENEGLVIDALLRTARGRSTLLVTHDLEFAARADRIVLIDDGRIAESGEPAEMAARGGAFARLLAARDGGSGVRHAVTS